MTKTTDQRTTSANAVRQTLNQLDGKHLVAVGLSGGVDSSLTAALLSEAGWKVEGLTLWLMSGKGSCCSDGLIDAAGICKQLNIPHNVIDARKTFEGEIIDGLITGYQKGITPLPCSHCNRAVKFSEMLSWINKNRPDFRLATGHYARIRYAKDASKTNNHNKNKTERIQLLRGIDQTKDQSYFLYDLSQEVLDKVVFPLGELTKVETRKEANRLGLRTAKKPESQDLCLAEHYGSMKAFLDTYLPSRKGEIVLKDGSIIGEHDGIEHFTIGQRKGLGVSWNEPLHVIKIEANSNRVVVAPRSDSGQLECTVGSINWVSIPPPEQIIYVEVQVRYRSIPVLAKLTPIKENSQDRINNRPYRCLLNFREKQFSVTPGQAAVFYKGDILLGGGLIER